MASVPDAAGGSGGGRVMVRVTPEHVLICLLGFVVVLFLIAAVLA
jgi:hypothetical protein